MTAPDQPPLPKHIQFAVPPDQEAGVYANVAAVWHDDDGFILDFSVITTPAQQATNDATGETVSLVNARVVSRVHIPGSQAWELMRALNTQLGQWEAERAARPDAGQA